MMTPKRLIELAVQGLTQKLRNGTSADEALADMLAIAQEHTQLTTFQWSTADTGTYTDNSAPNITVTKVLKPPMSAAARAKISAAMKLRWKAAKRTNGPLLTARRTR